MWEWMKNRRNELAGEAPLPEPQREPEQVMLHSTDNMRIRATKIERLLPVKMPYEFQAAIILKIQEVLEGYEQVDKEARERQQNQHGNQ